MTSHKHPYLNRNQRQRRTLGHQLLQQAEASALPLAFPTTRTRSAKEGGKPKGGRRLGRQRGSCHRGCQAQFLLHASISHRPANSTSAHRRPSDAEGTDPAADGQIQLGQRKPARHKRRRSTVVVATTTPPQPLPARGRIEPPLPAHGDAAPACRRLRAVSCTGANLPSTPRPRHESLLPTATPPQPAAGLRIISNIVADPSTSRRQPPSPGVPRLPLLGCATSPVARSRRHQIRRRRRRIRSHKPRRRAASRHAASPPRAEDGPPPGFGPAAAIPVGRAVSGGALRWRRGGGEKGRVAAAGRPRADDRERPFFFFWQ